MTIPDVSKRLSSALKQLSSDDALVQNQGVETLIAIGAQAIPGLQSLLKDERPDVRSQAMYTMAQIAAPEAAQAFQAGLHDPDERVRAYAALGLARINHPDALAASLLTINDAPDLLHLDMTPAVQAIGEMGIKAATSLLELLMSDDVETRLHAQRALELIVSRLYGFRPGQGFPTPEADIQVKDSWRDHGNYDYAANAASRAVAVSNLRDWLRTLMEQ